MNRNFTRSAVAAAASTLLLLGCGGGGTESTSLETSTAASTNKMIGINVLLNQAPSQAILTDIERLGRVRDVISPIHALTMQAREGDLAAVQALPYVVAASPDAERNGAPVDTVAASSLTDGLSTWNLDAINVTNRGFANRTVAQTGAGVYVAVLDTGMLDSWRQYFPQERVAVEHARAFGGGGGENGTVSQQPNKWEHDQNSHGTHVTSTILGYSLNGTPIAGVAPMSKVIPVKVLNQNGSGWSSVIARGIVYVADLKASGSLGAAPVVINMSLGGSVLDAVEKAALDYAIGKGVVIVAAAGNSGSRGMGYPGAYKPVISVAAAGHVAQGINPTWWYSTNVPEPTDASPLFIAGFSSRQLANQELDVTAPGAAIVGPYQVNSGQTSYYFLSGTSMASPHVAGVAALMLQKNPALTQAQVESILKGTALPMPGGCRSMMATGSQVCWSNTMASNATGAGFVLADQALNATPTPP
jgi:subtilisin family serine protease